MNASIIYAFTRSLDDECEIVSIYVRFGIVSSHRDFSFKRPETPELEFCRQGPRSLFAG